MKLGIQVGLGPGHIVSDGNPAPLPQKGHSPQFSAHVRCDQMAVWIKMPLGKEVGLGSGDFVLDGDPAPSPKKGHSPQLSAHVYCNQTAGRIKMPLGTEVGLGPGHMVLDGNPAPPRKMGTTPPPFFGACILWSLSPTYCWALVEVVTVWVQFLRHEEC